MAVILVEHIHKHFDKTLAVKDMGFEIPEPGVCFGFLGPNGAGKTTLMKLLYGRCRPDSSPAGRIRVMGYDPLHEELAIKALSGVVSQDNNLDDELNVIQNLRVYARFYGLDARTAATRIQDLLRFMELSEKSTAKITELSGGMKRRLVIVRALLNKPQLLILDEPTTGLDPQVRHLIWERLRELKASGTTILLTTHYMEEAFQLCDELLIMHEGQKVMQGHPKDLIRETIETYVLELIDPGTITELRRDQLPKQVRCEESQGILRMYSNDLDAIKSLTDCLAGSHYYLRQSNLEDVFLKTTGRSLNVRQ